MSELNVSERQLHILRHSLGLAQNGREYRNYFDPGLADEADCRMLEEQGLMSTFSAPWLPQPIYQCTEKGKHVARCNGIRNE
jgi:hypothetical protein